MDELDQSIKDPKNYIRTHMHDFATCADPFYCIYEPDNYLDNEEDTPDWAC